jgi:pyrroloquinoline quinone biosynthesis protein E
MGLARPYTIICELTYRCPLKCPYCSNPTDLDAHASEMTTAEWCRVLKEAEGIGVVQAHMTGGEPLARKDLEEIVAHAHEAGLYTNLITSAVPLTKERLVRLKDAGLDHVQVSLQSARREIADEIAGFQAHDRKLEAMRWVKELELPLTINVVLHRKNLSEVEALIALAEEFRADRLELANTQYHGWALANRDALLPARSEVERSAVIAARAKERLRGTIDVLFVKPDYFGVWPRACMDGWGRRFVHVVPDGTVFPCHAATSIPGLSFESARQRSLGEVWERSEGLNAFRGDSWMSEPCRSCERKTVDFGGCRCQAFALAGDPRATDPACSLSPHHAVIERAREEAERDETKRYLFRGQR